METLNEAIHAALKTATSTSTPPSTESSGWRPAAEEWHESIGRAVAACAQMVADMEREAEPYWLTLSGRPGTGKTMLARQTFAHARDCCNPGRHSLWLAGEGVYHDSNRRPLCQWFSAHSFKERMLAGEWDLPEYLRADYLVVVDDLGAARDTRGDMAADGLYRLADQRAHRWMLWTTNLTYRQISANIDERIASRMIRDSNKAIAITCGDFARRKTAGAIAP
jgi:DNA replication protein DnaC